MDARKHSASRIILASRHVIFRAFVDPEAVAKWRPPGGMTARVLEFDPRVGGGYRVTLTYDDASDHPGKSTADSDVIRGRFEELLPDERIVETVVFESHDPRFAGEMTITTTLSPVTGGTKVSFVAENVPPGISEADHKAGMAASLKNLADLVE
jgi:uncharacterized protein YndB with AHSA1/START domain